MFHHNDAAVRGAVKDDVSDVTVMRGQHNAVVDTMQIMADLQTQCT